MNIVPLQRYSEFLLGQDTYHTSKDRKKRSVCKARIARLYNLIRTKDLSFHRPCDHVNSGWVWVGQEEFQLPSCMLLLAPHALILHGNPELSAPCSSCALPKDSEVKEGFCGCVRKAGFQPCWQSTTCTGPSVGLTVDYRL